MIRLIKTSDLSLHEFEGRKTPKYAILSHRWEEGEISLQELQGNLNKQKAGWTKLQQFCKYADRKGYEFVWIDTCCIDKKSSAELSEAINSMFKWYRKADICYAYLCDVPARYNSPDWMQIFQKSKWFSRGWTLQELIAPRILIFICSSWEKSIGSKASLSREVSKVTGIPESALLHGVRSTAIGDFDFTVAEIMSWASSRCTTRVEDMAYSLMGLFSINMPLLYGEGLNAFMRLQLEIMSKYSDGSLFAWQMPTECRSVSPLGSMQDFNRPVEIGKTFDWSGLLAPVAQCFRKCSWASVPFWVDEDEPSYSMTSKGIKVETLLRRHGKDSKGKQLWLMPLGCAASARRGHRLGIILRGDGTHVTRAIDWLDPDSMLIEYDFGNELNDHDNMNNIPIKPNRDRFERRTFFIQQSWPTELDEL